MNKKRKNVYFIYGAHCSVGRHRKRMWHGEA